MELAFYILEVCRQIDQKMWKTLLKIILTPLVNLEMFGSLEAEGKESIGHDAEH